MSKVYTMNKAKDSTSAVINILSQIGNSWFEDGVIAKEFADDLKDLGNVTEIMVNIASNGGSVIEGMAIYHLLKDHPAEVTTNNVGTVASIASVIFMAGDKRIAPKSSLFLAHKPMGGMPMLNADEHRKVAEALDMHEKVISTVYADATGMSENDLADFLRDEKYIDGEEALTMGFATENGQDLQVAADVTQSKLEVRMIQVTSESEAKDMEIKALREVATKATADFDKLTTEHDEHVTKYDDLVAERDNSTVEPMAGKDVIAACDKLNCDSVATSLISREATKDQVDIALASIEKIRDVCKAADISDNAAIVALFDNPAEMISAVIEALAEDEGDTYIAPSFHQDSTPTEPFNAVTSMENFKRGKK